MFVPLFFSVWQCVGGPGGFCVQRYNHGHSVPFCCDAQKCPHFEIISPLLQGKLTKWNFISCLINTQLASAFCQRALCWNCSSLCYREQRAPSTSSGPAHNENTLEEERRRWCAAEGLTLINWDCWHWPHWFTCWRSPPLSCSQPLDITWVTGTWRSPQTSDSDTEHSFQYGIILFTTFSVLGLNTSGTSTWEHWVTPPLGWNYRALRSDSREVWTSPDAHPLLPRHGQIWGGWLLTAGGHSAFTSFLLKSYPAFPDTTDGLWNSYLLTSTVCKPPVTSPSTFPVASYAHHSFKPWDCHCGLPTAGVPWNKIEFFICSNCNEKNNSHIVFISHLSSSLLTECFQWSQSTLTTATEAKTWDIK